MTSIIVAFFVSLAVATVLTPLVLRMALKYRLYDQPNERKVHALPIPRLGGVAIVIAFFAPLTGLILIETGLTSGLTIGAGKVVALFVGGLAIAALGLFDDLKGADAKQKFAVQISVAIFMWLLGYRIEIVSNPFGGTLDLTWLSLPLTILWFVGVMNAVNLIDGLDGLAGGVSLISVVTLMVLALMNQNVLAALMCACLAGSIVGFLFFNFNPARIFMGDTGSLFLGFILAAFSISTSSKGSTAIALSAPLLALALPIADTMLAIGRRMRARRPIFSADQEHIHHRLLRAGLSHRNAVLVLYAVALSFAGFALLTRIASKPVAGLILLAAGIFIFILLKFLAGWHRLPRGLHDPFGADGLKARVALDAASMRLIASTSREAICRELESLAKSTQCISVSVIGADERPRYFYQREPTPHEAMRPLATYELPLESPSDASERAGRLEILFARNAEQGDLGVILPWERLRSAFAQTLHKHGWPTLQCPMPSSVEANRPVEVVPQMRPLPAWTRSTVRPRQRNA